MTNIFSKIKLNESQDIPVYSGTQNNGVKYTTYAHLLVEQCHLEEDNYVINAGEYNSDGINTVSNFGGFMSVPKLLVHSLGIKKVIGLRNFDHKCMNTGARSNLSMDKFSALYL